MHVLSPEMNRWAMKNASQVAVLMLRTSLPNRFASRCCDIWAGHRPLAGPGGAFRFAGPVLRSGKPKSAKEKVKYVRKILNRTQNIFYRSRK